MLKCDNARLWEAPGDIDSECKELCELLNMIPGIQTIGSCCGHNKKPFSISFDADSLEVLGMLTFLTEQTTMDDLGYWNIYSSTFAEIPVPASFELSGLHYSSAHVDRFIDIVKNWLINPHSISKHGWSKSDFDEYEKLLEQIIPERVAFACPSCEGLVLIEYMHYDCRHCGKSFLEGEGYEKSKMKVTGAKQ